VGLLKAARKLEPGIESHVLLEKISGPCLIRTGCREGRLMWRDGE
jgi:hypothetical protein